MRTDQRFTKQQRLLKPAEYGQVFKSAEFKVSTAALLILARNVGRDQARLGLVISKKNVGCAVRRNRVKRLLRETFRKQAGTVASLDLVVMARPGLSNLGNPEIIAMTQTLLDELARKVARSLKPPQI